MTPPTRAAESQVDAVTRAVWDELSATSEHAEKLAEIRQQIASDALPEVPMTHEDLTRMREEFLG